MSVQLPASLLKAVKEKKCILFIGSGLSSMAGYPTWAELIDSLVAEARKIPFARTGGLEDFEQRKDYFTLAEFARSELGVGQYSALLQKQLGRRVTPTHAHDVISRTDYRGLITTNYDRILETAITQARQWAPNTFSSESISSLANALYTPELFIFKLHGDVGKPETIVLTSRDYDRLILRSPHVRSFLQAVFLNYTLLFVGYSLRDPDFQLVLRELTLIFENYIPTHYALIPNAAEFTVEHLLKRMNIQTIPYSPEKNHQEAVEILEVLCKETPFVTESLTISSSDGSL
ncbi:MAG: SIR2 family protein [Methylococcales bacterium]